MKKKGFRWVEDCHRVIVLLKNRVGPGRFSRVVCTEIPLSVLSLPIEAYVIGQRCNHAPDFRQGVLGKLLVVDFIV